MYSLDRHRNKAILQYEDGHYKIVKSGSYVICAVTKERIPLNELKYWNSKRQEAYVNCQVAYERELECNCKLRCP